MQRLYSTFARGAPGLGLLLLRVVAGASAIAHGIAQLGTGLSAGPAILELLAIAAAALVLVGLWTPITASLVAVPELWAIVSQPAGDPLSRILLAAIGLALALLGPGAWSVDARLFGWRRIDVRDRNGRSHND